MTNNPKNEPSRVLTLAMIERCGANVKLSRSFYGSFGKSVVITADFCRTYVHNFDWEWAARNVLSLADYEAYYNTGVEHRTNRDRKSAYAAVKSVFDAAKIKAEANLDAALPASDTKDLNIQTLWDVYYAEVKAAQKAYNAALNEAHTACLAARAEAFARIYIASGSRDRGQPRSDTAETHLIARCLRRLIRWTTYAAPSST